MRAAEGSRHSSSRGDKAGNSRSKSIKQRSKTSHRYAVFDKWAGTSLRTCLYTHTECTEGRPIFICSTENGPAFQQSPRVQPRSEEKCPPSVFSHPARAGGATGCCAVFSSMMRMMKLILLLILIIIRPGLNVQSAPHSEPAPLSRHL